MEWAYVAGYFDGEGHVSLHQTKRGSFVRALTWWNSHRESLEAMRTFMGVGNVHLTREAKGGPVYSLSITNKRDLLHVLGHLIPHLVVKREQAIALREALSLVDDKRSENHGKVTSVDAGQLREWYVDEGLSLKGIAQKLGVTPSAVLQEMKRRGIPRRAAGGAQQRGVPKSAETRRRMSESRRRLWADPAFRAKQMKNLARGAPSLKGKPRPARERAAS